MRRPLLVAVAASLGSGLAASCLLPAYDVGGSGGATTSGSGATASGTSSSTTTAGTGGAATTSSSSSAGGGACAAPCVPANECQTSSCVGGQCVQANVLVGKAVTSQITGDCKKLVCDGNGNVTSIDDPSDVLDDGKPCTNDVCQQGMPKNVPVAMGTPCTQNGGKTCDAAGGCVACLTSNDCASGVCQANACVPATCTDGSKNGNETDVDCGGSCNPCLPTKHCATGTDCTTGVCTNTVCQAASCTDGTRNGNETDIDCGGSCNPCGPPKHCVVGADCTTLVCTTTVCQAASCTDGTKNASETDVDCGGGACPTCADGKVCKAGGDCTGVVCTTALVCCTPAGMAATCTGKCGGVADNCGQMVTCPGCQAPATCGGGGAPHVCGTPATLWAKSFPGPGAATPAGVIVDASSAAIVAGSFSAGSIDFGAGQVAPQGGSDVFLVKTDTGGSYVWSRTFGGAGSDQAGGLALDSAGDSVLIGTFSGTSDYGAGAMTALATDVVLAKYDPSGTAVWTRRFGDASGQDGLAVAAGAAGSLYVGGDFNGSFNFGGGASISAAGPPPATDGFVAKLDSSGVQVWAKGLGTSAAAESVSGVAVDAAGNVYATGSYSGGATSVGGASLPAPVGSALFVLKLDAAGTFLWSKGAAPSGTSLSAGPIAVDGSGDVILGGSAAGDIDLGGGVLHCGAGSNQGTYVVKLDPAGNHLWSKCFLGTKSNGAGGLVLDTAGNLFVQGFFGGTVDFGGGAVTSASQSVFLLKLTPAGAFTHLKTYDFGAGRALALYASGHAIVTGTFSPTIDLGTGPLAAGGSALTTYLAKVTP